MVVKLSYNRTINMFTNDTLCMSSHAITYVLQFHSNEHASLGCAARLRTLCIHRRHPSFCLVVIKETDI